ncbi:MAG: hypothetical protein WCD70_13000 [Alphaproteobacteria bacterium]
MKPIQTGFKIAGELLCLPYKYRDTAGFTVLAAYAVSQLLQGDIKAAPYVVATWGFREIIRGIAWMFPVPTVVGGNSTPVNHTKNMNAAYFVGTSILIGSWVGLKALNLNSSWGMLIAPLIQNSIAGVQLKSSLRDIPDLYFDKKTGMWDWPSKQGGGGMKETKKLLSAISDFGKSLTAVAPQPIPIPVGPPRRQRTSAPT